MASVTEMREWLRGEGHDVPARGRLRPELVDVYEAAHPVITSSDDDWDIADLDDLAGADVEDLEPSVPMTPERRPRTERSSRQAARARPARTRTDQWVGKLLGTPKDPKKAGPKKKAPPRVSLEKFASRMYGSLGRAVRPLSVPMSNCLQAQAAMAGVILEDVASNTVLDRVLQPVARAEDKLDKAFALVAPPLCVLALEASMQLPEQQAAVRQALIMPVLRESLRIGLEVAESYGDVLVRRIEENAKRDAEIDALIEMIFTVPVAPAPAPQPEPEMAGAAA